MNTVSLVGVLASAPKPVSETQTPCVSARLCVEEVGKDGQTYRLWVPVEAWAQAAVTLAPLGEGTPLAISGKLKWKSWTKDGQRQGSLVVSCFTVDVLDARQAPVTRQD
jgi:single-stranded DNA-binding protein